MKAGQAYRLLWQSMCGGIGGLAGGIRGWGRLVLDAGSLGTKGGEAGRDQDFQGGVPPPCLRVPGLERGRGNGSDRGGARPRPQRT